MADGAEKWRLKSRLEAARARISKEGGDTEQKKEKLALFEASMRVVEQKLIQKSISDLPTFELPENATVHQLLQFLKDRLQRYEVVKSFDIGDGVALVTPPTKEVTYHIVNITRPHEDDPEDSVSVLQFLTRETDNYTVGFRPTPEVPTDPDGFFIFSDPDIVLPPYFGVRHILPCKSNYQFISEIQIGDNILRDFVQSLLLIDEDNYRRISDNTKVMMETSMVFLGECQRMHAPLEFLMTNYSRHFPIDLSAEVIMYVGNWSYLSKAAFDFYLAMLEAAMGVAGSRETFNRQRRSLMAAVRKFEQKGLELDLKGVHGFFSLRKLAGNCIRLLKYDETYVKQLIMRRSLEYKSKFKGIKHSEEDRKRAKISDAEKAEETEEWEFWKRLLKEDEDNLRMVLLEQSGEDDDYDPWRGV